MKLITVQKVIEGCMLPKAWACIIFSKEIIGFALYIPWIFNGSYYDPMRNLKRFGWRIPRVLFQFDIKGYDLRFNSFHWYEAI